MARGTITDPDDLRVGERYRLYRNGRQVDAVKLHIVNEAKNVGYVARSRHEELEEVDLTDWLDIYAVLPENGVPTEHELVTTRTTYPPCTTSSM